jgi:hypothetical protein
LKSEQKEGIIKIALTGGKKFIDKITGLRGFFFSLDRWKKMY